MHGVQFNSEEKPGREEFGKRQTIRSLKCAATE